MINKALDIDWLRKNKERIYHFGLGFIQVKIDEKHRVHFYTDALPKTSSEEEIHNHRYDFTSYILKGVLTQHLYQVTEGDKYSDYTLKAESCNPEIKAPKVKHPYRNVKLLNTTSMMEGSYYTLDKDTFHRVESVNAITLLSRGKIENAWAEVVCMRDVISECPFQYKDLKEDDLWNIIKECLK